jgi:hypothetical protein
MTIIQVDPGRGGWSITPNFLIERSDLSIEARFFIIWCLVKPPGWQLRVAHIQRKLEWGEHKWLRVAAELRSAGYLQYKVARLKNGQFDKKLIVRAEPLPPHPDHPGVAQPGVGEPDPVDPGVYTKNNKTRNIEDNNNPITQTTEKKQKVVVDGKLVESGLLSTTEAAEIKATALNLVGENARAQVIADELCGQIRMKGRVGLRGIKHPVRLLKVLANSDALDFAVNERELREAREQAAVRQLATFGEVCKQAPQTFKLPPPAFTEYLAALKNRK